MAVCGALLGIREDLLDLQLLRNFPGRGSMCILHDSSRRIQETRGKDELLRIFMRDKKMQTDRLSAFIRVSCPTEQLLHMSSPVRAVITL